MLIFKGERDINTNTPVTLYCDGTELAVRFNFYDRGKLSKKFWKCQTSEIWVRSHCASTTLQLRFFLVQCWVLTALPWHSTRPSALALRLITSAIRSQNIWCIHAASLNRSHCDLQSSVHPPPRNEATSQLWGLFVIIYHITSQLISVVSLVLCAKDRRR